MRALFAILLAFSLPAAAQDWGRYAWSTPPAVPTLSAPPTVAWYPQTFPLVIQPYVPSFAIKRADPAFIEKPAGALFPTPPNPGQPLRR